MIVCHPLKLLFVKTKKVGGTSFEIALSAFCGEDCLITPITRADEETRTAMGFRGAQNYENPRWPGFNAETKGIFYNHMPAGQIKSGVPKALWDNYRKITIVRNPFDVAISRYWWEGGPASGMTFEEYVIANPGQLKENQLIAPLNGDVVLDHYLRYENLETDLHAIGLGKIFKISRNIRAKSEIRPENGASMSEVYASSPRAVALVAKHCAAEIQHFGYAGPMALPA